MTAFDHNNSLMDSYLSGFAKSLDITNEISLFKSEVKIASMDDIWKDVWKDLDIAMNELNKVYNLKIENGHIKKIESSEESKS